MHISVLLDEILDCFSEKQLTTFVDCTLGAGGHSLSILREHPEIERLIGFDQDPQAIGIAQEKLKDFENKTTFIYSNFQQLKEQLQKNGVSKVSGILIDLGVSSMQLDQAEKGFSFMHNGPLDMRMDPNGPLTAEEIVNLWPEHELCRIFRDYGEEKFWRYAARLIVKGRADKPIKTTHDLVEVLKPFSYKKKEKNKSIHPLTLVFQGLRICVNRELEVVEKVIPDAIQLLEPGGRLAVISFHSLEDRIVKNIFRFAASDKLSTSGIGGMFLDKTPEVKLISGKPIMETDENIAKNPRSRSAKLRIIEKI